MTGSGGGKGAGDVSALGINWTSVIQQIAVLFGGHGAGTTAGRSAQQSAYAAMRAQQEAARQAAYSFRYQMAANAAAKIPSGQVIVQDVITPRTKELAASLSKFLTARDSANAAKKGSKRAYVDMLRAKKAAAALARETQNAGGPQFLAVAQYGPNNGPPVYGSSDYYALGGR